jgi:hypothetical protein
MTATAPGPAAKQRRLTRLERRPLIVAGLSGLALALLLLFSEHLARQFQLASGAAVAAGIAACVGTAVVRPRGASSISVGFVYALLLALFHVGLLVFSAMAAPIAFFNESDAAWFSSPALGPAAMSVAVGSTGFCFAYAAAVCLRGGPSRSQSGSEPDADPALGLIGFALLGSGTLVFFWSAWTSGVTLIGSSYGEFLQSTRGAGLLPAAYLLVGLGVAVTASARSGTWRTIGIATFAAFAVPAILIGLRGEVILPAAAWLAVEARRRAIRLRPMHALMLLGTLSLGSMVRQIRQQGFSLTALGDLSLSPLNGLIEMGYSLRPLMLVHTWHDNHLEPFLGFSSYLDPVDRLVRGAALGLSVPAANVDPRAFLPVIANRAGPIGGSSVAEAYYAAGTLGIVVVLGLLGVLAARLDRLPSAPVTDALVGMLAVILFVWIRNDTTPVVGQLLVVSGVMVAIKISQFIRRSRLRGRPPVVPIG